VSYYLGIDGGGTKTTGELGDESRILATVVTGPSNVVRVGEQRARESLHEAVRQACAAAGIAPGDIACTCIGASGAGRPEIATVVRNTLAEILPNQIEVIGDLETSLDAAFDTGPGVIVIAGTGSSAYGRNSRGITTRAGGWGFAIGDEGSAHWIGREAVRAVLRASEETDAGPQTSVFRPFAAALCEAWGVSSLIDLARIANSVPPPDFAVLFPAVAGSKDELAVQIQLNAGKELARIAGIVCRHLFPANETGAVPVAMIGGVFRYSSGVRASFYNELRRLDPRVEVAAEVVEPVHGALRMARVSAKSLFDNSVVQRMKHDD
jgi:glucosamine kinase